MTLAARMPQSLYGIPATLGDDQKEDENVRGPHPESQRPRA